MEIFLPSGKKWLSFYAPAILHPQSKAMGKKVERDGVCLQKRNEQQSKSSSPTFCVIKKLECTIPF